MSAREVLGVFGIGIIGICALRGILLWRRILLRCHRPWEPSLSLSMPPLTPAVLFFIGLGTILIPHVCQNLTAPWWQKLGDSPIERTFFLIIQGECALCIWILYWLQQIKDARICLRKKRIGETLKHIFTGYCLSLPWVFCTHLLWSSLLSLFTQCGLGIDQRPQLIIRLLLQYTPPFYLLIPLFLGIVFLAPFCEEILFRGFLLRTLCAHCSLRKSLWISSFLFALVHWDVATFFPLFCLGYGLGLYYIKTDNIFVSMGIHGVFNGMNFVMLYSIVTSEGA